MCCSAVADKSKNRGFAFVEYDSHKSAAIARRHCVSGNFQLWGKAVAVDWAEPEPVVDDEILSKVSKPVYWPSHSLCSCLSLLLN